MITEAQSEERNDVEPMRIPVKKMKNGARLPSRESCLAAGYDLYACLEDDLIIEPHQTMLAGTGISMAVPEGYFGGIFARSGLSVKEGLRPANCVGVIDPDYRGEVMVALHNDSSETRRVTDGERIAQLVVLPYLTCVFEEEGELEKTERGAGGFGSTGQ